VVPWDGSSSTVIPSQAIDPAGNTHVLYTTGIGTASLLFEAYFTPAAQSPGPSAALYNNPQYYTCSHDFFVTAAANGGAGTLGNPWDIITASNQALAPGSCIHVATGNYTTKISANGGLGLSHGGTSSAINGYVVWRCQALSTTFSAGAVTGEGTGCVLGDTAGTHVVSVASGTNFVMMDGFEFSGTAAQQGVCFNIDFAGDTSQAAKAHHIWSLNNDLHGCGNGGIVWDYTDWLFAIHNVWHDNATTNGDCGSGLSFFQQAGLSGYTPTPGNPDYWHSTTTGRTYNNVIAYNAGYHNYNAAAANCSGGGPTDGEGIIMDTPDWSGNCNGGPGHGTGICPYTGNTLLMGNAMWGNGGRGIEMFSMTGPPASTAHYDIINNTTYSNDWDPNDVGSFGGQVYADLGLNSTFWNNIGITVTGSRTCVNAGFTCSALDQQGNGTDSWRSNMTYPAGNTSFGGGVTYPLTGTNKNFDGTNPNLTTLTPITARSGGGSTGISNFALQAGSPAIGAGQAFDLWQQSTGPVDIGACVHSLSVCPTSAGGTWITGIALPGHADQSTLQPTIAPTWNGVQAWWGQSANFPTLPDNGFTATSTTLGTWSGATEFLAAGSSEIAMFSTVTTNQYPYGAAPFPVVFSETIQGGSNTNLRIWPFNGAAATGNDVVTFNAVDSLSNHAVQQITALKVAPWDSTVWNNPQSISSVTHGTFVSPSTNLTIGYQIYFPANYTTGSNFPVVYFLHGNGGNENEEPNDYPSQMQNELNSLIAAGTIQPMIAVFPNGGSDSKYQNAAFGAPAYSNYNGETQILELIQFVDATYKTNPTRAGRALQGFSMGGQGCERIGFKYPQLFSSLYCIAPAIDDNASNVVANEPALMTAMYGGTATVNTTAFQNNTAQNIATQNAKNIAGTAIHVLIGNAPSETLLAVNQSMDAQLSSLGIAHDVLQIASGCGHDLICDLNTAGNGSNWIFASTRFAPAVQVQNIADDSTVPAGYKMTFNEEFSTLNTISTVNSGTFVPGVQWYVGNIQCCIVPNGGESGQMYPTPDPTTGAPIYPFALIPGGGLDANLTKLGNNWNSAVPDTLASATAGVPASQGPGGGFSQQYGYFEIAMQVSPDVGTWPAFWMFPVNNTVNNGEIDIIEQYGTFVNSYCATLHSWSNTALSTGSCSGPIAETPFNFYNGYHIFSLLWTPTLMTFYVDGFLYYSHVPLDAANGDPTNAMGGPYYLIFDHGICSGGGCPQSVDPPNSPETLKIKYIRAYQLTPGENLAATFDPNPANAGFYVSVSNNNLTATIADNISSTAFQSARSTRSHAVGTGKYYFECTFNSDGANGSNPINMALGIYNSSASLGISSGGVYPGSDGNSAALDGTGGWFLNGVSNGDFTPWVQGDTVGIAIDTTAQLVWQIVMHAGNASNWNGSLNGNPAAGTGGVSISSITGPYFAACGGSPQATANNVSVTANFGNSTYNIVTVPTNASAFGPGFPVGFRNW
jgi:S-formylglutathione hydrolase FrmB